MTDKTVSDINIITLKPMRVACYRAISQEPEKDSTRYLYDWFTQQDLVLPPTRFGFDVEVPPGLHKNGCRGYETWIALSRHVNTAMGVTIQDFAGGLYATMTIYQPYTNNGYWISYGWKLLHEWVIVGELYRSANHQWLEEWIPQENGDDLRLYHPVKPLDKELLT